MTTLNRADDGLRSLLESRTNRMVRLLLLAAGSALFFLMAFHARYAKIDEFYGGDPTSRLQLTAGVYTAIFALSFGIQLRVGRRLPLWALIFSGIMTGAVLLAKISLLDYESDDYQIFLTNWIYNYTKYGIKEGLGRYLESDYTPPYLYLLQIISRVRYYPWNYLVKAWSILAEVLLCYTVMRISSLKVKGEGAQLLIWHMTSMLPTVVFNGAYWGQCDAIYVGFCLLALWLGITGRGARSMICFGVALSFKLQTVFFLPVMLPLWLRGNLKLRYLPLIPAAYMAMMIPALWGGKSLHHVLTCYSSQAGKYNFISMNGTNVWHLLPRDVMGQYAFRMFGTLAMCMGFAVMLAYCVLVCWKRDRLSDESVVLCCLLMLSAVPYFLPKMHERYTFGADVLSVAAAAHNPRRAYLPLLFGLASYICYTGGLPGMEIFHLRWASVIQGTAVCLTGYALWKSLQGTRADAGMEVKG